MSVEAARRASEVLLALAVIQQALEHVTTLPSDRRWAVPQIPLALAVAAGVAPLLVQGVLLVVSLRLVRHHGGPYNGGSDRIRLLLLAGLWASHLADALAGGAGPGGTMWTRLAIGYVAVQVLLSYTLAGYVKLVNPDWRRGLALADVFRFSVYPVSEALRAWAASRPLLFALSWVIILFEVLFPLALLQPAWLSAALAVALVFHLVNASVFGLNRFVWAWLATYPCLLWFQGEVTRALQP